MCVYVCVCVCMCVCVCACVVIQKQTDLEYIVVLSVHSQGHCRSSNIFPIYHNTNCQVV